MPTAICDGFENQAAGAPTGNWTVTYPDCSGAGTATIDKTVGHTGTTSLRVNGAAGYCNHVFVRNTAILGTTSNVWYVRYWVRHTTALPAAHVAAVAMRDANDSGKDLRFFDDQESDESARRYLPHVIEPSAGADRGALAFLCDAYSEDEVGGEQRTVLKLHPRLAPIKAAVFPLVKKDGMPEKALAIYRALKKRFNVFYDEKGAIGRRYRRQDEAGTPYCITIDGDTLTADTVTVRERDSCAQVRLGADELAGFLAEKLGT